MLESSPPPVAASQIPLARPLLAEPAARPPFGSDLYLTEISRRGAWLDVLLLLIVPIGMIYVPSMIMWASVPEGETPEIRRFDYVVAGIKWAEFLLVAFIAMYFILRNGVRPRSLGIRFDGLGRQLAWAVATLISCYVYVLVSGLILLLILSLLGPELAQREMSQRQQLVRAVGPEQSTLLSLALVLAVGFHEELLFRGLLLTHLRRASGRWIVAIVLSSLLFGALHFVQGWIAMIQVTGLSVVLSLIFIASRSILTVGLAHAAFDFCQLQFLQLLPRVIEWLREQGFEMPEPPV